MGRFPADGGLPAGKAVVAGSDSLEFLMGESYIVTISSCRISFKPALLRCFFDEDVSIPSWDMNLACFVCSSCVADFFFCHCSAN